MTKKISASIVGGSGYTGGELLRLLLQHPSIALQQVTSESNAGKKVTIVHPNLRKQTELRFCSMKDLQQCDVLFLALPHGMAMQRLSSFAALTSKIIDLSADFRLKNAADYPRWYGHEHRTPELLKKFVYGIPELHREEMKTAAYISSAGCNATCALLGLYPLVKKQLLDPAKEIIAEAKCGSSEAGNKPSLGSHHPERTNCVRSYMPVQHRHSAEILQELSFHGNIPFHFSATAIQLVRGILTTAHVFLKEGVGEKEVWNAYREVYGQEPFIRIVKEREGVYRYPEPKILAGTNYCDIGFEKDPESSRLVVISAIDNLMKGAAGQAIQAMNIQHGFPETTGLTFSGLHPI